MDAVGADHGLGVVAGLGHFLREGGVAEDRVPHDAFAVHLVAHRGIQAGVLVVLGDQGFKGFAGGQTGLDVVQLRLFALEHGVLGRFHGQAGFFQLLLGDGLFGYGFLSGLGNGFFSGSSFCFRSLSSGFFSGSGFGFRGFGGGFLSRSGFFGRGFRGALLSLELGQQGVIVFIGILVGLQQRLVHLDQDVGHVAVAGGHIVQVHAVVHGGQLAHIGAVAHHGLMLGHQLVVGILDHFLGHGFFGHQGADQAVIAGVELLGFQQGIHAVAGGVQGFFRLLAQLGPGFLRILGEVEGNILVHIAVPHRLDFVAHLRELFLGVFQVAFFLHHQLQYAVDLELLHRLGVGHGHLLLSVIADHVVTFALVNRLAVDGGQHGIAVLKHLGLCGGLSCFGKGRAQQQGKRQHQRQGFSCKLHHHGFHPFAYRFQSGSIIAQVRKKIMNKL